MITKNETAEDYSFMLQSLKDYSTIINFPYSPSILLADAASAITNGFSSVFPLKKRIICWAHVKRAFNSKLRSIENKSIKDKIRLDIHLFQNHVTDTDFKHVAQLMITSWRTEYLPNAQVEEFISYFMKMWLAPARSGWYDHFLDYNPCTNNALESTNRYVKDNGTYRGRLPISEFLVLIEKGFIRNWSLDRRPTVSVEKEGAFIEEKNINQIIFATVPTIPQQGFTTAYQFDKLKKKFKKYSHQEIKYWCVPSSDSRKELTEPECKEYFEKNRFLSFKYYIKLKDKSIKHLQYNKSAWQLTKCNCWYWCKHYHCKHTLAFCEMKNHFDYNLEHKQIPLGANQRRGRPKKTVSALEYQPHDFNAQEYPNSDTESEDEEEKRPRISKKRKAPEEIEE